MSKHNKDNILQEAAQKALAGVPSVTVQQCMYMSMSTLSASPVRVYVETKFCKGSPKRLPGQSVEDWKLARSEWKAQAQADARHAIVVAGVVLKEAGFKFKSVEDYGWAQLTLTGKAGL